MKKIKYYLTLCLAILSVFLLASCDSGSTTTQKLAVPAVTISETGLASWEAVPNAKGYRYVIDDNEVQLTTSTSVQLEDGQEIKVKAVGGGDYTDSAYCAPVKYTAPVVKQIGLPTPGVGYYIKNADLIQDGEVRYLTYITNKVQAEEENVVAVRKATLDAEGWIYEEEQTIALEGAQGAWDEYITSASLVKGVFNYQGTEYAWLLVYAATDKANETCNEIGLAVANDPSEAFVRVGTTPVITYDETIHNAFVGVSSPSAVNYNKVSGIRIFYTYADAYGAFARFHDIDCANLDAITPVDAAYTIHMTNKGNLQGGEDVLMFPNADFAYNAAEGKFVCVKDVSPAGSTNPKVATAVEVAWIAEAELYTTDVEVGFTSLGAFDGFDLGTVYERVYNASLVSDAYGHALEAMEVVYNVSDLEADNADYIYSQYLRDFVVE